MRGLADRRKPKVCGRLQEAFCSCHHDPLILERGFRVTAKHLPVLMRVTYPCHLREAKNRGSAKPRGSWSPKVLVCPLSSRLQDMKTQSSTRHRPSGEGDAGGVDHRDHTSKLDPRSVASPLQATAEVSPPHRRPADLAKGSQGCSQPEPRRYT